MPTCDPRLLSPIMLEVMALQPHSILDIGVGTGKWGTLVREYTDLWNQKSKIFDLKAPDAVVIDGIEIYKDYENSLWHNYNYVVVGDACDIVPRLESHYDLALFIEVLEHIPKEAGQTLIVEVLKRCTFIIISYTNNEQGTWFDNVHESHVSRWCLEDIQNLCISFRHIASIGGITEAFVIGGVR